MRCLLEPRHCTVVRCLEYESTQGTKFQRATQVFSLNQSPIFHWKEVCSQVPNGG